MQPHGYSTTSNALWGSIVTSTLGIMHPIAHGHNVWHRMQRCVIGHAIAVFKTHSYNCMEAILVIRAGNELCCPNTNKCSARTGIWTQRTIDRTRTQTRTHPASEHKHEHNTNTCSGSSYMMLRVMITSKSHFFRIIIWSSCMVVTYDHHTQSDTSLLIIVNDDHT